MSSNVREYKRNGCASVCENALKACSMDFSVATKGPGMLAPFLSQVCCKSVHPYPVPQQIDTESHGGVKFAKHSSQCGFKRAKRGHHQAAEGGARGTTAAGGQGSSILGTPVEAQTDTYENGTPPSSSSGRSGVSNADSLAMATCSARRDFLRSAASASRFSWARLTSEPGRIGPTARP